MAAGGLVKSACLMSVHVAYIFVINDEGGVFQDLLGALMSDVVDH